MWGRGRHTGVVPIMSGYLLYEHARLAGGWIRVDMTAIGITDMPPHESVPIALLTKHLKDPLFLDVETFPEATFRITDVSEKEDGGCEVGGNLQIKDVEHRIVVPLQTPPNRRNCRAPGATGYRTRFRIDRFAWHIAYRGGFGARRFSARNFVDRYIELDVSLVPARWDAEIGTR
jgi:polyisoprenoid-binding protein YceI